MNHIIKKIKVELESADIQIDGSKPWDIQVKDSRLFNRILRQGSLGLGEGYIDGWWEAKALDEFFTRVLRAGLEKRVYGKPAMIFENLKSLLTNRQSKDKAHEIGEHHYDIGNDLYIAMLDTRMVYTCGYWQQAKSLDEAQEAKLDLVCKKIGLQPGQRVLDIGCGWGSFAKYAAEVYGAEVVGITISNEQVELGRERCKGLPVEIRFQDYREVNEPFDHIVSLGMIEHVGSKNYRTYMQTVHRCLKDEGRFILHTIGSNESVRTTDPWIEKYIFPNSQLPSARQLSLAAEGLFVMEDWQNFGAHYDKTLMTWYQNFEEHWDELKSNYSERFYRMWKYYLLSCAGSFRARKNQLWQIVFTKQGIPDGFTAPRYRTNK
ncbi:cyclopropane fatty acyl phospholipid synthase [Gracilimonas tropica]|uniref:cyclopropane fatty acyl phospholipid synthase n=1 Tax=Gracilimonas tropica TaxID=454600 RepID=UPI00038114AF|nr:cyclopropane fatty acyl phospholipid synthase [Gracilimonas tropica]